MHDEMNDAFESLYSDDSFALELGRFVLSASRFEAILKKFLQAKASGSKLEKASMGNLLRKLKNSQYIGCTLDYHLSFILQQRNYFVHQLYDRLTGFMLDRTEVNQFRNRVKGLQDELDSFANLFEEALKNAENETQLSSAEQSLNR